MYEVVCKYLNHDEETLEYNIASEEEAEFLRAEYQLAFGDDFTVEYHERSSVWDR